MQSRSPSNPYKALTVPCNRPLDSHPVHWQGSFAHSARFSGSHRIRHWSLPLGNSHLDSTNSYKTGFIGLYQNLIRHPELQQPLSAEKALYHLLHLTKKKTEWPFVAGLSHLKDQAGPWSQDYFLYPVIHLHWQCFVLLVTFLIILIHQVSEILKISYYSFQTNSSKFQTVLFICYNKWCDFCF